MSNAIRNFRGTSLVTPVLFSRKLFYGALVVAGLLLLAIPGFTAIDDTVADRVLGQLTFTHGIADLVDAGGLDEAQNVAIDRNSTPNHVYVSDSGNNRVLAWLDAASFANGAPADVAIGRPDALSSLCNTISASRLCNPVGLAVDASGNLYVSDLDNHRVLEFDSPLTTDLVADRVFGQGGDFTTGTCNNGGTSASSLCEPVGVAVDSAGNLYVGDSNNHRVLEYNTPLTTDTVADRVFGQGGNFGTNACNNGGISAGTFCDPEGVAVDGAGNLYVADRDNSRALEFNTPLTTDTIADRVFGQSGDFTASFCDTTADALCNPDGLDVDGAGNLYIADEENSRVLEYDAPLTTDMTADRVFGQGGSFTTFDCGDPANAGTLCFPLDVAIDSAGHLYVADFDNSRVLKYDTPLSSATANHVLGQADFSHVLENRVDGRGLDFPTDVAVDRSSMPNHIYVADGSNNRVLAWNDAATFANGAPADLVIGQPDAVSYMCNNGGLSASTLCNPYGLAVDGAGHLYVADGDNNRVLEYDPPFTTDKVADRVFGQGGSFTSGICDSGGISAGSLCFPSGMVLDGAGNLYLADVANNRVLEFDAPLTTDTIADRVFGQGGSFASNGCNNGGVTADSLCDPLGLTVDRIGNLFVADMSNNRVLEFDTPLTAGTTADRVFGQAGSFTSVTCNNGGIGAASLCGPDGAAVDSGGNLYVADGNNNRFLEFDAPLTTDLVADRVFGQGGSFTTGACNLGSSVPSAGSLCNAAGVNLDSANNLYIGDTNNNRVLAFDAPIAYDFGDAPESGTNYPTTLARDGARHGASALQLGPKKDLEGEGQPNAIATGDDLTGGDEDGVSFGATIAGATAGLTANIVGADGSATLDAWIDFNRNGSWSDAGEKILSGVSVTNGNNNLTFTVPAGASPGTTFARVRLSTAGSAAPTGAAPDGEVEDYQVTLVAADKTPDPFSFTPVTNAPLSTVETSNTVTISGINLPVDISVTGGSYSIGCGGTFTAASGTISNGQTVCVRQTSSATHSTTTTTTLTVGTVSANYNVTTVQATVGFASGSEIASEGVGTAIVTVSLSAASGVTVTMPFSVTGGGASNPADYSVATSSPLSFAPGETIKTISIPIVNDTLDEDDETVVLALGAPTNANLGTTTGNTLTIQDDDPPPTVAFTTATESAIESFGTVNLTVSLSTASGKAITVPFSVTGTATNGSDYTLSTAGPLSFAPGQTSKTISVSIINDTAVESNETVVLSFGTLINATPGSNTSNTLTIVDDDSYLQLSSANYTVSEKAGSLKVMLTRVGSFPAAASVTLTTSDIITTAGADYTAVNTTVSWAANDGATKTVSIPIIDDTLVEGDEDFSITLSNATSASLGSPTVARVLIKDDEAPALFCDTYRKHIIVGTKGNDTIYGSEGDDVILGLGGNDRIDGRGGNDCIEGGSGNDSITGGDGDDSIYGLGGDDLLQGGNGDDVLYGGPRNDTIVGGAGNNTCVGNGGTDTFSGCNQVR